MIEFVKLFNSQKYGQLLAMRTTDDEERECVHFYCHPGGVLGVCRVSLNSDSEEHGVKQMDSVFNSLTLESVEATVGRIFEAAATLNED